MRRTVAALALLLLTALAQAQPAGDLPRPAALEPDVRFWTRVYTEVDTRSGFLHDSRDLSVVYETLRFPSNAGPRTQRRLVKAAKRRYQAILATLAKGKRRDLSGEEARVLALWPEDVSNGTLRAARHRLRFQLGQSDKFEAGLARSGLYEAHIRKILAGMNLPEELVALPHVESSFNPKARSRVGAAGMWQFTRSTGRRFMRIDRNVDERMDPYLSTLAAAKLLAHNYAATGTWPLAITSYNHGTAGMRRAARKLGTKDIARIVRKYKSRSFGFASRNFYVAFLAAVDIHFNPEKYFGEIRRHAPAPTQLVRVPDYVRVDTLERALGIDKDELREHNPALLSSIWRGDKYVPRGFELRIPATQPRGQMLAALEQIGEDERYARQVRDRFYKVRRGNTLDGIARKFEVDIDELVALNNLRNRHRIRAGQVLALPPPDGAAAEPVIVAKDGKYTVRRGDSVWLIAKRLGVDAEKLVAFNDLSDGDRIHVGQVLRVEPEKTEPVQVASIEQAEAAPATESESAQNTEHVASIESPAAEASAEPARAGAAQVPSSEAADIGEAAPAGDAASERSLIAYGAPVSEEAAGAAVNEAVEQAADDSPGETLDENLGENLGETLDEAEAEAAEDGEHPHVDEDLIAKVEQAEPVTAEEAEAIAPAQPVSAQPDLSADPSDYSVADNRSIEVQAAETLGHYAEWLEIRAWDLRRLNGMRYGRPVVIGQRLELDFSKVSASDFEHRRLDYHRGLQEAFFQRFRIAGTDTHVVRRGESLWVLARRTFEIPIWLLRQYNPDLDFNSVIAGVSVTVPKLEPIEEPEPAGTTTAKADAPPAAVAP